MGEILKIPFRFVSYFALDRVITSSHGIIELIMDLSVAKLSQRIPEPETRFVFRGNFPIGTGNGIWCLVTIDSSTLIDRSRRRSIFRVVRYP